MRESAGATTTNFSASDLPTQDGPNAPLAASTGYDTPTFTWNSVTGAAQYDLFVADNLSPQVAVFGSAKAGLSVSGTLFTPTSFTPGMLQALTPGHNYTWYLGAEVASGRHLLGRAGALLTRHAEPASAVRPQRYHRGGRRLRYADL